MSKGKTLYEICNEYAVTRRAVQGYEKEGLVSSTGKNKYGCMNCDATMKRIGLVCLLVFAPLQR
ncbi:MAG: hypothetical protein GX567_05155 [Clostridia bacterium]|nr:hypothetical protein [Clostridia bacterium]